MLRKNLLLYIIAAFVVYSMTVLPDLAVIYIFLFGFSLRTQTTIALFFKLRNIEYTPENIRKSKFIGNMLMLLSAGLVVLFFLERFFNP